MTYQEHELVFVPRVSQWHYEMTGVSWLDRMTVNSASTFETTSIDCICGKIVCPHCLTLKDDVSFRWRNSSYINEQLNILLCCEECHEIDDRYLADMWADYWSSVR